MLAEVGPVLHFAQGVEHDDVRDVPAELERLPYPAGEPVVAVDKVIAAPLLLLEADDAAAKLRQVLLQ